MPSAKNIKQSDSDQWKTRALDLIARQKTMVLATGAEDHSWAAPVYYVHIPPAFFFFSSPRSRHIEDALNNQQSAACLFSDSDQWKQIEGLQMIGRIEAVEKKTELIRVTAGYLVKFPFARELLYGRRKTEINLSDDVKLYGFYPEAAYYMNNTMGFGSRREITLS